MAKSKIQRKKKSNKQVVGKPKKRSQGPRQRPMALLDGAAIDHIRLMADPCNGKLCAPAYESPGGGALMRYRRIITVGAFTGETAGVVSWAPGANEYVANGATSNVAAFTPFREAMFPGLVTPSNDVRGNSFRCVAACARMITNSSESNRSGIVYAGNTDYNQYWWNGTGQANVENVFPGLPVSTRAPSRSLELVWTPSESDTDFVTDSAGTALAQGGYGRSSLTMAFSGAPAASGYTIEFTAVYEVAFGVNQGLLSPKSPPASSSSWNNVLRGFANMINNSPVIIDGVRRLTDYVGRVGASHVGGIASRAAVGLLM